VAKTRLSLDEMVRRAGPLPMTVLASAEPARKKTATTQGSQEMRVARTLVGSLPGADARVARVAEKLARLVALSQSGSADSSQRRRASEPRKARTRQQNG
jgi:hypothetical protein